jgi:hypothetical protein
MRFHYILDSERRPTPVDVSTMDGLTAWAEMMGRDANRTVGYTQITSEIMVSTIFLGLDHRYSGDGPPLLFETMVFGGPLNESMWRYSSWDDAEAGHRAAVRKACEAAGREGA